MTVSNSIFCGDAVTTNFRSTGHWAMSSSY